MNNNLIILMGTSGVGKSYVARGLVSDGYKHFEIDILIRERLKKNNHEVTPAERAHVTAVLGDLVSESLSRGDNVVVAEWFYLPDSFSWIKQLSGFPRENICFFHLKTDIDTVLSRTDSKKGKERPLIEAVKNNFRVTVDEPGINFEIFDPLIIDTTQKSREEIISIINETILEETGKSDKERTDKKVSAFGLLPLVAKESWKVLQTDIVNPDLETEVDSVSAPCVVYDRGTYKMWYSARGADGRFRIHYATNPDITNSADWKKHGMIFENQDYAHVTDPYVLIVNNNYLMYCTVHDSRNRILLAKSGDGITWEKQGIVLDVTPASWDCEQVCRPSVLYESGKFKLWYNGSDGIHSSMGYAESVDGRKFERTLSPVLSNIGAVNVSKVCGKYVVLTGGENGIMVSVGRNETQFSHPIHLLDKGEGVLSQITPFLLAREGLVAMYFANKRTEKPEKCGIGMAAYFPG